MEYFDKPTKTQKFLNTKSCFEWGVFHLNAMAGWDGCRDSTPWPYSHDRFWSDQSDL